MSSSGPPKDREPKSQKRGQPITHQRDHQQKAEERFSIISDEEEALDTAFASHIGTNPSRDSREQQARICSRMLDDVSRGIGYITQAENVLDQHFAEDEEERYLPDEDEIEEQNDPSINEVFPESFYDDISKGGERAENRMRAALKKAKEGGEELLAKLQEWLEQIKASGKASLERLRQYAKDSNKRFADYYVMAILTSWNYVTKAKGLMNSNIAEPAKRVFNEIAQEISTCIGKIQQLLGDVKANITQQVGALPGKIKTAADDFAKYLKEGTQASYEAAKKSATNALNTLRFLGNILRSGLTNSIQGARTALKTKVGEIETACHQFIKRINNADLTKASKTERNFFKELAKDFAKGVENFKKRHGLAKPKGDREWGVEMTEFPKGNSNRSVPKQ